MKNSKLAQYMPVTSGAEIQRENIHTLIDSILTGETELVAIEGSDGAGKTTVLKQYAFRNEGKVLCIFINNLSNWRYVNELVYGDILEQIKIILDEPSATPPDSSIEPLLKAAMLKLVRHCRRQTSHFTIIIDGLDEIPGEYQNVKDGLIGIIPTGISNIKFLVSKTTKKEEVFRVDKRKNILLVPLTPDEAKSFISSNLCEDRHLDEIYKTSKGVPGTLASIARILAGKTAEEQERVISNLPTQLPAIFQCEWENSEPIDADDVKILAIIAFEKLGVIISELAEYTNLDAIVLAERVKRFTFIQVDSLSGIISYKSESFRAYVENKLAPQKREVTEIIIKTLLNKPDTSVAYQNLPKYLKQNGQLDELLNYLSPERIHEIVRLSESCFPVIKKTELGIESAKILKRDGDLLRFSAQKSTLTDIERMEGWKSEIEAQIDLGNYTLAIALAESAVLIEHRLKFLSAIGYKLKENNHDIPPELISLIRSLYAKLDVDRLYDEENELASTLIAVAPDLAIDLVERKKRPSQDEQPDITFAQLSILATAPDATSGGKNNSSEILRNKIKSDQVRGISEAALILISDYSVEKVLMEIEKIEKPRDRIYFLQAWTRNNARNKLAYKATEYALDLLIKTTDYTPDASVYKELIAPLPACDNPVARKVLVERIGAQLKSIELIGPSDEFIALLLCLAESELLGSREDCIQRFMNAYFFTAELTDLSSKSVCYARLDRALTKFNIRDEIEKREGVCSIIEGEFTASIDSILQQTANHFLSLEKVLKITATYDAIKARKISERLNTLPRRETALCEVACIGAKHKAINYKEVWNGAVEVIDSGPIKDTLIIKTLRILSRIKSPEIEDFEFFKVVSHRLSHVFESENKCLALTLIAKTEVDWRIRENLDPAHLDLLDKTWTAIDQGWRRLDVGFKIASALSKHDKVKASYYLNKSIDEKRSVKFMGTDGAVPYLSCLHLAIRAFSGLVAGPTILEDIAKLHELINEIPSAGDRAKMWSEIAVRLHAAGRSDLCKQICTENIRPAINSISQIDLGFRSVAIQCSSVALFCGHPASALELLKELPNQFRDNALNDVIDYVCRKTPPDDPYEENSTKAYNLTWESILDIFTAAEALESDYLIYKAVRIIANAIADRRSSFSVQQRQDISARLMSILNRKLPAKRYILHDGYKIIAEAQCLQIVKIKDADLSRLYDQTLLIRNVADRAFILTTLGAIAEKAGCQSSQIFQQAKSEIERIPVDADRIEHYEYLADQTQSCSVAICKQCLQLAIVETLKSGDQNIGNIQRRLVDLIHKVEPEKRELLTALLDKDPARADKRRHIEDAIKAIDVRKKMSDVDAIISDNDSVDEKHSEAAWRLLGSLHAKRIAAVHISKTREIFSLASKLPLSTAYSMLSYAIESLVVRYGKTNEANTLLRPLYEALLSNTKLAHWIGSYGAKVNVIVASGPSDNFMAVPGSRRDVFEYIESWLRGSQDVQFLVCDPYFSYDDLRLIALFKNILPKAKIEIITSKNKKNKTLDDGVVNLEDQYRLTWRVKISDAEPCETRITIASFRHDGSPAIHDRWILGEKSGIRLGTSINSIGEIRLSELSIINEADVSQIRPSVLRYILHEVREVKDMRIDYSTFSL